MGSTDVAAAPAGAEQASRHGGVPGDLPGPTTVTDGPVIDGAPRTDGHDHTPPPYPSPGVPPPPLQVPDAAPFDRRRPAWEDHPHAKLATAASAFALGAVCFYTATTDPSEEGAYPLCPLRALTGVDCALCGGLRTAHALMNLDVERAAGHNILLLLAAPLLAYTTVQWLAAPWGLRLPSLPVRSWMAPVAVILVVVFSIVRNLPWGPFPWLYSGD